MNKVQIVFPSSPDRSGLHKYFAEEAEAMKSKGFLVGTTLLQEAELLIYRGFTIDSSEKYPSDSRYIQGWNENSKTLHMNEYIDEIREWTFGTFSVSELSDDVLCKELSERGWKRAFIKTSGTSLFAFGDDASVWPTTSAEKMLELYKRLNAKGPYIVREFIENKEIFYDEQRYWVLKGVAYHPSGQVPDFVQEAALRMWKFSGSQYFTIDVAGEYIVEVNPGESSDRGGDNPVEFLSSIFANAFLAQDNVLL